MFRQAGKDILAGGTLDDLLSGGLGNDTYVLLNYYTNVSDQTLDFETGKDIALAQIADHPALAASDFHVA